MERVDLEDPTDAELAEAGERFNLPELAVEDAQEAHQRAKVEDYDGTLFVVLRPARYDDDREDVVLGELHLFVKEGCLVTVRRGVPALPAEGETPVEVLHDVADHVVDGYLPTLDELERDVREVEAQVFSTDSENPTERIYGLKREVLELHGAFGGLVGGLDVLARGRHELVPLELREHFRDVHDHLLTIAGRTEELRELLNGALQANLAQVSVRQNEDVRKVSAWVAIFAVPTAIAGIYGMNFEHMPELKEPWAYPAVLLFIVVVCTAIFAWFKRSGWL
jgi:magnesium transporter